MYQGQTLNKKLDGPGKFYWPNGICYTGELLLLSFVLKRLNPLCFNKMSTLERLGVCLRLINYAEL